MSQIGSSVSQVPLAAPAAAVNGQIRSAESNQRQAEAGDRNFLISRDRQLDQTVNDVGDPGQSDDRDADGRMAWSGPGGDSGGPASGENPDKTTHPRAPDPLEERGMQLDVEA
jgi:hypothetical protein